MSVRRKIELDLYRAESLFWENWLGIRTRTTRLPYERSRDAEHKIYTPTIYRTIFRVLRSLPLKASDVFVDLGCGKGRVVCCAAYLGAAQVIGVEYVKELHDIAVNNAERMRRRQSPIAINLGEVEDFDFSLGTVFFMFNSFGRATLESILTKMEDGLRKNPREIRIAYVNPVYGLAMKERPWLERYGFWRRFDVVMLWRSKPGHQSGISTVGRYPSAGRAIPDGQ